MRHVFFSNLPERPYFWRGVDETTGAMPTFETLDAALDWAGNLLAHTVREIEPDCHGWQLIHDTGIAGPFGYQLINRRLGRYVGFTCEQTALQYAENHPVIAAAADGAPSPSSRPLRGGQGRP
jgi:hypothetical protein